MPPELKRDGSEKQFRMIQTMFQQLIMEKEWAEEVTLKLEEQIRNKIGEYLVGFIVRRSCIYHIYTVQKLIEISQKSI